MKQIKSTATARVQITIELSAASNWGAECSLSQIYDQAGTETVAKVRNHLREIGARIIGEPKVVAVLATPAEA